MSKLLRLLTIGFVLITSGAVHADEANYWRDKAACLDPNAYEYSVGTFSATVPAGATWYVINALTMDGGPLYWSQRYLDVDNAMIVPEGTVLASKPGSVALLYVCKPELVYSDPRYLNARELYYARLTRIGSLQLRSLTVSVSAGSSVTSQPSVNFPADFERALMVHASAEDVSWLTLGGCAEACPQVNVFHEISNTHQLRMGTKALVPFKRSVFGTIKIAPSNLPGDYTTPALAGQGTVHYVVLPLDW